MVDGNASGIVFGKQNTARGETDEPMQFFLNRKQYTYNVGKSPFIKFKNPTILLFATSWRTVPVLKGARCR